MSAMPLPGSDISYSIRHVEEGWHHLIKSDDTKRLKEIAVCNFDFLLAAVSLNHCTEYILSHKIQQVNDQLSLDCKIKNN